MEHFDKEYCIEVVGDFACFTRPEFKVERVSYDIITPSAVRGIFDSIFWKPAIKWRPTKVEVISGLDQWFSLCRNEVGAVASTRTDAVFIEEKRQQRASRILKNVHYRLHAEMVYVPVSKREVVQESDRKDENPGKYQAIFERRMSKGQVFNQPYLGCREFSCSSIRLIENMSVEPDPIQATRDLGYILYDMDFSDASNPEPAFFRAQLTNGVMRIPSWDSEEVIS
ncbi:MAG: type I-C CRISPR-associated protein Cas5c [Raoultibacter sp.]|jgi:CRISPR-associated protein Cas5d